MDAEELKRGLAREDFARLLAACYYQPGAELGEEGVFTSLIAAAPLIDLTLAEQAVVLDQAFAAETKEELLLDYSRLFLGPFEILAKPYGSVWLEGEKIIMGESTMAVAALYQTAGFALADEFREAPDHVAAELEFLYLLIFRENEARRSADMEGLQQILRLKKKFLEHHLGQWIRPFAEAIQHGAQTGFYHRLALLTDAFVQIEKGWA